MNPSRLMDNITERRRIGCVLGHLLPVCESTALLRQIPLGGKDAEDGNCEVVIIGGMILDIHATSSIPPSPRTTAPGNVRYIRGGVARNVAECMAKLGTRPYIISALGTDMAGTLLLQHWNSEGLLTEGIRIHHSIQTPVVCNIFDTHGELSSAVASVEAIENFLDLEWIQHCQHKIHCAPIMMVDANLNPHALEACCAAASKFDVPVWFEPVSVSKSKRISSVFQHVTIVSPNEDEVISMANRLSGGNLFTHFGRKNCETGLSISLCKEAALILLEKGIKIVIVTLGANGILVCAKGSDYMKFKLPRIREGGAFSDAVSSSFPSTLPFLKKENASDVVVAHFPALPTCVLKLTGAGDCFVGGALASLFHGLNIMQSAAIGVAVAKAAVQADTNVPSQLNLATIIGIIT